MRDIAKWQKAALWSLPLLVMFFLLVRRPQFFTNPLYLVAALLIEIVLAALWHYRSFYFVLTMIFFIWAGTDVPFEGAALTARWIVLGAGAIAGAVIWMRERRHSMNALHLAAFLCVPVAAVTAMESGDPATSLLKVASLFLLFLYSATGIRVALAGREVQFVQGLLRGCEITVYLTALCYAAGFAVWGNPNSLGAVVGVVMMPFLLWGFLVAEGRIEKLRMRIALALCGVLLYVALSRASILAALVSCLTLCICLKRQRVIVQGIFGAVLLLAVAAVISPGHYDQFTSNLRTELIHKGKNEKGVLNSRTGPWDQTVASLKQHPWFGTGFGTSDIGSKGPVAQISALAGVYTKEGKNREHGNSYLAIAEYVGILGCLTFGVLLLLVARMVVQMCLWMRRTSNARHCAIPLSMILLAGFVHAFFEDWLIAVGYYLCVFFWVAAFLLSDLMPERRPAHYRVPSPAHPHMDAPGGAVFAQPQ
jgi:O-antigen ligase